MKLKWIGTYFSGMDSRNSEDRSSSRYIARYMLGSWRHGQEPNDFFDSRWYADHYGLTRLWNPLLHYVLIGWRRGYSPARHFSAKSYLMDHEDVNIAGFEPLLHYLSYGRKERRLVRVIHIEHPNTKSISATGLFDQRYYYRRYDDIQETRIDALEHFAIAGRREMRSPNAFCDLAYLRSQIPTAHHECELEYFWHTGWREGVNPSPAFDVKKYLDANPDVSESGICPLTHFLVHGRSEGRLPYAVGSAMPHRNHVSQKKLVDDPEILIATSVKPVAQPPCQTKQNSTLRLDVVIPDFSRGGGGHSTIFRLIHLLEMNGVTVVVWIVRPSLHKNSETAWQDAVRWYFPLNARFEIYNPGTFHPRGQAVMATSWDTAYVVASSTQPARRFYLIQDFECMFHPMGTKYLLAENTYRFGLDCICASPWLKTLMVEHYDRWADFFWLAADTDIYSKRNPKRGFGRARIAVYARLHTERRAVELAILGLEKLAKLNFDFEVDLFGQDFGPFDVGFPCRSHGILSPTELAALYNAAEVGVVFSTTNYSLVPQEMMACGLAVVELDGPSTRSVYPEGVVTLVKPDPDSIALGIKHLLTDRESRQQQSVAAQRWVASQTWRAAAERVEAALRVRSNVPKPVPLKVGRPLASIIIPTLNGGPRFREVIEALGKQRVPYSFELVVIDSGSSDDTIATARAFGDVTVKEIGRADFNHGETRNQAAEIARGEYLAFLTQDAVPDSDDWLFNLVGILKRFDNAAGAFGRHIAHKSADPFTARDLKQFFNYFDEMRSPYMDRTSLPDPDLSDVQWEQKLVFFSDNNSCLKRRVWEKVKFPRTDFGEDQLWMRDALAKGYGKVYSQHATVRHSHDFDENDALTRANAEAAFFLRHFGWSMVDEADSQDQVVRRLDEADRQFALSGNISENVTNRRFQYNLARVRGMRSALNSLAIEGYGINLSCDER